MNQKDREKKRLIAVKKNIKDAAPVVKALNSAGFKIYSIGDLYNKRMNYQSAVPILIEWLPKVLNPEVKDTIVRALSVKWAKNTMAVPLLLAEFEKVEDATGSGLRWTIGNALEVLANDEISEEMIKLATDRRYGRARQMIVLGLGKLKDTRVIDVLIDLLNDDDLIPHAVAALGKLRANKALTYLEPLLNHPRSLVRSEAKKAIMRIKKGK